MLLRFYRRRLECSWVTCGVLSGLLGFSRGLLGSLGSLFGLCEFTGVTGILWGLSKASGD